MEENQEKPKKELSFKEKYQKIAKFTAKYSVIIVLLLILVLQYMPNSEGTMPWGGMYMRGLTEDLPQTDKWAKQSVETFYKAQLTTIINQQYPNLPDTNKKEVLADKWTEFQEENQKDIKNQIEATKQQFLDHFQYNYEGEKYLYMPDIDPYFYLRQARNIKETGVPYDELKDGQPWDNHMFAPLGYPAKDSFHAYTLYFIYKINKIFDEKIDLMQAAAKFSLIFILLSIILAYFIGLKIAGKTAGFFSALMMGILPAILTRTPWGHADTDAYNIFFPLLAIFTLFIALDSKKLKNKIIWSIITGAVFFVYSYAWNSWWFVFDAVIGGLGLWILIEIIKACKTKKYKELKQSIIPAASLFLSTAILITLFEGFNIFMNFLTKPIKKTAIKVAAHSNLWPNVYTTVAELNAGTLTKIIQSVGGNILFIISLLGIILALTTKDKKGKRNIKLAAILTVWFIASIYASMKGVRFTLLLGPAFAIAFGVGAGIIITKLSEFGKQSLGISKKAGTIILVLLFGVIIATSGITSTAYKATTNDIPIVNDAWWNSLTKIKEESQPNAIINSWWDYGHHFKYIADRAVTFDGGSQNSPMALWIGRVLSTKDEKEAIGILRMLDCGSNTAFEKIDEKFQDTSKSVNLLYEIIVLDKEQAGEKLKENNFENYEEILQYTHCEPPENFFITSGDMVGKAGVWSHFGLWDFAKADMWVNMRDYDKNKVVTTLKEKYNMTEEKAENYYNQMQSITNEEEANQWISSFLGFPTKWATCESEDGKLVCNNGITMDMNTKETQVQTQQGTGIPYSVVYMNKEGKLIEKKQNNQNLGLSVLFVPTKDYKYQALLMSPELTTSIFTRLYYLDGHGLKHFKKFDEQNEVTYGPLYVWKIDWNGGEENILNAIKPKTEVTAGDNVQVNYIGWLDNGTVFDSSITEWDEKGITKDTSFEGQETSPLPFTAGSGKMISGFDKGVIGMKQGEEKTITIPPEEAYGTDPEAHFLANKTLNFKIKIEKII